MRNKRLWPGAAVTAAACICGSAAEAQTVPPGYSFSTIANGLSNATCMAQLPDGRVLIAKQTGELRVWKDGALLATPMHTFSVNSTGEQGLIGVAASPTFADDGYVYAYIITPSPGSRGKLVRFTVEPGMDVSQAGSQVELFDLGLASGIHLGGEIQFGNDGKLYIALGDHASGGNAQVLTSIFGKILRLNADGTIPEDNPFYAVTTGDNRSIWARGLRNPFTFAFDRATGRMFINDVGAGTWEEINDGVAGANYGWPTTEGAFDAAIYPQFTNPLLAYHHSLPGSLGFTGYVVVGGAVYNPAVKNFPASLDDAYFFGDYGRGWVRTMDTATNVSTEFATGMSQVLDFDLDSAGRLLVLRRGTLVRVQYDNPVGACCMGFICTTVLEADCAAAGGEFQGIAVACLAAGEPATCCTADFDGNGLVEVPDIFAFLSGWFGGNAAADIDELDGLAVPDIFAFLSMWFAGCGE